LLAQTDRKIIAVEINNYLLGAKQRSLIKEQIIRRSISVANGAFEHGEFNILRDMMKNVPIPHRTFKIWIKATIAQLPFPMARAVRNGLMRSGETL
jgi:hypothetical protein